MAGPRYIAEPGTLSGAVELEGLTFLFHPRSGTTHALAPPAPQIIAALAGRAATLEEVVARMAERYELASDDPQAAIAARLAELEAAGLVRQA